MGSQPLEFRGLSIVTHMKVPTFEFMKYRAWTQATVISLLFLTFGLPLAIRFGQKDTSVDSNS